MAGTDWDPVLTLEEWEKDAYDGASLVSSPNLGSGDRIYRPVSDATEIDLEDIVYIASHKVPSEYYHALSKTAYKEAIDDWEARFRYADAAATIVERIITWKRNGSDSKAAYQHEALVKQKWNIEGTPRCKDNYGSERCFEPPEEEELAIQHLRDLSQFYLNRHYTGSLETYRGCSHYLPQITAGLFRRPQRVHINIEPSILLNLTISRPTAETYSPIVLERETKPNEVGLATDHLLWHTPDDTASETQATDTAEANGGTKMGVPYADGELQVFGDEIQSIDRTSLKFIGTSEPLANLIASIPKRDITGEVPEVAEKGGFSPEDHRAIALCLQKLHESNEELSDQTAQMRVLNWYQILTVDDPETPFEGYPDEDEEITFESLVNRIESLTGEDVQREVGKVARRLEDV